MKTTTTTREYDADGNLTKETVVEYDGGSIVQTACTCLWHAYPTGYTWCPVHGQRYPVRVVSQRSFTGAIGTGTGVMYNVNADATAN